MTPTSWASLSLNRRAPDPGRRPGAPIRHGLPTPPRVPGPRPAWPPTIHAERPPGPASLLAHNARSPGRPRTPGPACACTRLARSRGHRPPMRPAPREPKNPRHCRANVRYQPRRRRGRRGRAHDWRNVQKSPSWRIGAPGRSHAAVPDSCLRVEQRTGRVKHPRSWPTTRRTAPTSSLRPP